MRFSSFAAASLLFGLTGLSSVFAADDVTDAMQKAYVPYRAALFKTNAKAQAESVAAIASARQMWAELQARFGSQPPAPYNRDTQFAASLAQVDDVYHKALTQATENQLAQAHETLEEARDLMAALRKRNHVVVFSDAMNAYHAQMEHVLETAPGALATPGHHAPLVAAVGALDYLAQQLVANAPGAQAAQPDFQRGLQAVLASVRALQAALWSQDDAAARAALGQLKPPYSKFFLQFG